MKKIIWFLGTIFLLSQMAGAASALKKGFVTYSEGDGGSRTLKYRPITDGVLGPAKTIVEKGEAGGDIEGVISFDGKWIAFARKREAKCSKQGGQWNGNGEDDYHKWHCVGVFVARLDGDLPTTPIKVVDEGYFPSWSDDSFGPEKTLYFGVWTKGEIWKATISDAGNKVSEAVKHTTVPGWEAGDHHMQCSPNGKLIAIRYGGKVSVVGINGNTHNKVVGGGCHPSWFPDSKHLYHAQSSVRNIEGESVGKAGKYHFGSSSNLKWAITLTNGVGSNQQNNGWQVGFGPVEYNKTDSVITSVGPYDTKVTEKGNFPDIHDFEGLPVSKPPAPINLKLETTGSKVKVAWSMPPNAAATSYIIYRGEVKIDTCDTTEYVDSNLTGTEVSYSVAAVNEAGEGAKSAAQKITSIKLPNGNAAFFSTRVTTSQGGQVIINTAIPGTHAIELYDLNGVRKAKVVKSRSARTVISTKNFAEGMYFLRVNFGEASAQSKLMIKKLMIKKSCSD